MKKFWMMGVGAALVMIGLGLAGVSVTSNAVYGFSIGDGVFPLVAGVGGGVMDAGKSLIPAALVLIGAGGVSAGAFGSAFKGVSPRQAIGAFWVLTALSVFCAYSNYLLGTETKAGRIEAARATHAELTAEKPEVEAAIASLRASLARTAEVIAAEVATKKRDPIYTKTSGAPPWSAHCTDDSSDEAREFCRDLRAIEAELAAARPAAEIRAEMSNKKLRLGEIEAGLGGIDQTDLKIDADPGLEKVMASLGLPASVGGAARAMIYALSFESGSIFLKLGVMVLMAAGAISIRTEEATPISAAVADAQHDGDDDLREWLLSETTKQRGGRILSKDLRASWNAYASGHGLRQHNQTSFGRAMSRVGPGVGMTRPKGGEARYVGRAVRPQVGGLRAIAGGRA